MTDTLARAAAVLALAISIIVGAITLSTANAPVDLAADSLKFTGGLTVSSGVGTPGLKVVVNTTGTGTPAAPILLVNSAGTTIAQINQAGTVVAAGYATP